MANCFGRLASGVILVLLFCAVCAYPQATVVDQISGVVKDQTGATIRGAQVKAVQSNTSFSRSTITGPDGSYILTNLPIGPYRLEVSAKGFKAYRQRGIVLEVSVNPTVNVVLQVGEISQQVEVQANAQMSETQTTGISQVIGAQRVVNLPLNGRNPTQLVLLSGAAVMPPGSDLASSKNYPSSTTIAVAGGQANGTLYLMDGGDYNDAFGAINLPIPFPDALQEFSVQTNAIPAKYGGRAGGVVNIVTKSGSNAFHGDLFEFLRNGAVNAKNYFASTVDQLKRNQFGGTIGGPIVHDKLFFFGGYQGTVIHTAPPTTTSFVPTSRALNGDFSEMASGDCGKSRAIIDPDTGEPFPNNQIPASRFSSQALNLLKFIPSSSDPCGKVIYSIPNNSTENQYIGRVDWSQSQRHTIFGRYFYAHDNNPAIYNNNNLLLTTRPGINDLSQSLAIGDSYTLSSSAINSIHFTWAREHINRGPASGLPTLSDIGLNVAQSPGNFPNISVNSFFTTLCGICSHAQVYTGTKQIADDFDIIKGRNQVAFGGEWIRRTTNYQTTTQQNAAFGFNGSATGYALADFLLGLPSSFIQGNVTRVNYVQDYVGLYASDNIHIGPRLSANVGLRWEPYFPEVEQQKRVTHFDLQSFIAGKKSQVFHNAPAGLFFPGDPGMQRAGTNRRYNNFSPRAGVVWDVFGNALTVVRAGYGVLYDLPPMQYFDRFGFGPPWASAITLNDPIGGFGNPYLGFPGGDPFPLPIPPTPNATFTPEGQYANLPLHIRSSNIQQWNLNVQQQIGKNWLFSLNYLGNKGTHLWFQTQEDPAIYIPGKCNGAPCSTVANTNSRRVLAQLDPKSGSAFSSIILVDDGGNSSYQAMLATLNHRLASGFSLLLNYTWSHCISDGAITSEMTNSYQNPYDRAADRGNCVTDERQIFNASLLASTPQFNRKWTRLFLSDWELAAIVTAHTGLWLTPGTGRDASLTGVGFDRPNVVGDANNVANHTLERWFDTDAFSQNPPGTYGDARRGSIQGPGGYSNDLAIFRKFPFRAFDKPQYFEVRVEAFNALNHPVFHDPSTTFTSHNFGRILSAYDPRIMQLAVKYVF